MTGMLTTIRGRAKRLVGKATGNRRLATKGKAEETKGGAKRKAEHVKGGARRKAKHAGHKADRAVGKAKARVKAH
jgi:uncharacterized protein YjbJ (UPF0337 family)